jgi:hypothetical protein
LFNIQLHVHATENEDSHSWSSIHNTPMLLWSEQRWAEEVNRSGFEVLHQWRSGRREHNKEGTMTIIARNRNREGVCDKSD